MSVNLKSIIALLLVYAALTSWSSILLAASGDQISVIEILGNVKTRVQVIRQEMIVKEGDQFDPQQVERSRQNIMDLGLFKSVELSEARTEDGIEVTFTVDEKRYWYLIPVFNRGSDGDITWGLRMQMDNLLGLNNQFTMRAKRKDFKDTDIQLEKTLELEYDYPRIFGSAYDLALRFDFDEADIEESRGVLSGDYFREKITYGGSVSKWLTQDGSSKGYRLTLGLRSDVFDHEYLGGDPNLFTDVTVNSLLGAIQYIDVVDHGSYRSGRHHGMEVEMANSLVNSDVIHMSYNMLLRRYISLNSEKRTNLNLQSRFGYITRSVFGDATYQVTGGTAIRGYNRDSIEGDTYYIANVEYLRPLGGRENLRGTAFIDAGDAFDELSDFTFRDPKVGIGFGFRWKIRSFVRTDIRLDIAQGLGSEGETKIYAGTRATF